jgi:Na+-transporting NADH:ubiquinone oxidoreductase subunit NqrB
LAVLFHGELKCRISFGNWFWHLIVGNMSIVLNFYQQRPVFA